MKLRPKRKILLFALVFFVFSAVFAETLTASSIHHDCKETVCLICLKAETAKSLKLASVTLFFASSLALCAMIPKSHIEINDYPLSPVVLKVRSNS